MNKSALGESQALLQPFLLNNTLQASIEAAEKLKSPLMDSGYPNRAESYAGQPPPILSQALPPGSTPATAFSPAPAHSGYYGMAPADDRYRPPYGGPMASPGSYRGGPSRAGRSDDQGVDQYGRASRDVDRRSLSPPGRASYGRGATPGYGPPDRSYRQPRGRSPLPGMSFSFSFEPSLATEQRVAFLCVERSPQSEI